MRALRWGGLGLTVVTMMGLTPPAPAASAAPTAAAALAQLPRKGRAPMTGYDRLRFGPAWTDAVNAAGGHNGCDTRNDVLRRDLTGLRLRSGGCVVTAGVLNDPYTGRRIVFARNAQNRGKVQIDHLVALGDAWQTGAQGWSAVKRVQLANDPLNLLAVDGPTNESKRDADAASWLPRPAFRCAYVARQIAVKRKYGLWVTTAEGAAMARVLRSCPGRPLPTAASTSTPPIARSAPPKPRRTPVPRRGGAVYYANCDEVRAAGKAPLHRGQPGYRPGLDRDGDGLACDRR